MNEASKCQTLRKGIKAIRLELEELANAIANDRVAELNIEQDFAIHIKPANFFEEITQADLLPEDEHLFRKVVTLITDLGYASTIVLQQKLGINYGQAVNVVADLERDGLVEPAHGFRPHKVLPAAYTMRERLEISMEKQSLKEYQNGLLAISS
jgi:DNA segregation ATPase FtsK/SpoIIIE-like protein